MPRGGFRPGAGRPKQGETKQDIADAATAAGLTPLEYMLAVMRDPTATTERRDRMAQAAAPYCHKRAADSAPTKKEQAEAAAQTAGQGTAWSALLQ